ncbi:MAG: hypothetical protein JWM62_752 [Frankiales bacterium]|nr:hypothetical protein [Frankiales bacterium]
MTRWLLAVLLALTALAGPAAALDTDGLAERLGDDPVLVDPRSGIRIDQDAVLEAVEAAPVPTYVLLLPQRDVDSDESGIDGVLLRVVEALDDPRAVVVVVTDAGELQAGEGGSSGVEASALLDRIVQARSEQAFNGTALTAALVEFAEGVASGSQEGAERGVSGVDRQAVGVAGLIGVAIVGGGVLWLRSQRKVQREAPLTEDVISSGGW